MSEPIRATVDEAAKLLGTSANALRKRIERGTIQSEKVDGVRYVLLSDRDMSQHAFDTADDMPHRSAAPSPDIVTSMSAVVDSLEEQVDYLRRQLEVWQEEARRKDHIIAALAERIPAIEASSEPREQPETVSEDSDSIQTPPTQERPSWWRLFFGLHRQSFRQ
jgi:excisionase family DNA binding protein